MTDWSIVVLTGALVLITAYYAWQNKRMVIELQRQHEAMGQQLLEMRIQTQLGLYRPRLAVLRSVRRALSYVARDGKVPGETLGELIRAGGEKEFLFGPELCSYLDDLYRRCVETYTLHTQLAGLLQVGEQRTRLVATESKQLRWILDQLPALRERFKPYLRIEHPREGNQTSP